MCVKLLFGNCFSSFRFSPRSGSPGSFCNSAVQFSGTATMFSTAALLFDITTGCTRVPVSPQPHQYLLFSIKILMSVSFSLIICCFSFSCVLLKRPSFQTTKTEHDRFLGKPRTTFLSNLLSKTYFLALTLKSYN